MLQFLDGDGCQALIITTSIERDVAVDLYAVGPIVPTTAASDATLPDDIDADIGLADASIQALLRAVAGDTRARGFVVGYETDDGGQIEAAWPDAEVALLIDGQVAPDGWTARPATDWDATTLLDALTKGRD